METDKKTTNPNIDNLQEINGGEEKEDVIMPEKRRKRVTFYNRYGEKRSFLVKRKRGN